MANYVGTKGNDTYNGTNADDEIRGRDGGDTLRGGAGNDKIYGENGTDLLEGQDGDDLLDGGQGTDRLFGGLGRDRLWGGIGDDQIDGGAGTDTAYFSGNIADYSITTVNGVTTVVDLKSKVDGAEGTDTLTGVERLVFIKSGSIYYVTPNQGPLAAADSFSVAENGSATGNVLTNDSDADADSVSVSAVNGSAAAVGATITLTSGALLTLNASGSYTYNSNGAFEGLDDGETGSDSFQYTINDGFGGSSIATVTVTINGADDQPTIAPVYIAGYTENSGLQYLSLTYGASDPDIEDVHVVAGSISASSSNPARMVVFSENVANGDLPFIDLGQFGDLDDGESETITFSYSITDGDGPGVPNTFTLVIAGSNDAPQTSATDEDRTGTEDTPVNGTLLAGTDVDDEPLTFREGSTAAVGGSVSINAATGAYTFTPDANFNGTASFSYLVNDGTADSAEKTVEIEIAGVNDAPEATLDYYFAVEDTPLTFDVRGNDTDVENDALTVTMIDGTPISAGGSVAVSGGSVRLEADGRLTFTPSLNLNGVTAASFVYTVSDGNGGTATGQVGLDISAVNDAPANSVPGAQSVDEDTALVFSSTSGNPIQISDVDAATLQVSLSVANGTLTLASVSGLTFDSGANGSSTMTISGSKEDINTALQGLSYTGNLNFNGSDTLSITTSDLGNSGSGGTLTDSDTVAITINAVNDAPVANLDYYFAVEDTPLTFDVRGNDTDVEGHALTVTEINGTAITAGGSVAVSGGSVRLESDGRLTFTPALNLNGVSAASFLYTVSDGNGGTATGQVGLDISAVNDAPANSVPGAQSVDEDMALVFSNANGNAISVTDVEGGSKQVTLSVTNGTLTLASVTGLTFDAGTNGSSTMTISGSQEDINLALAGLSYQPNVNFNGSDTLSITTSDLGSSGSGGTLTDSESVAITVNAVNDSPVANLDYYYAVEDTPLTFDVRGNDTDVEGNALTVTAINGTAIAVGGSVAIGGGSVRLEADGRLTFTPSLNLNGVTAASFVYTVSDGNGGTSTGQVGFDISAVNDVPGPVTDTDGAAGATVAENLAVGSAVGIDADATDPDGDTLTYYFRNSGGIAVQTLNGFTINATTGVVTLAAALDYETATNHSLTIYAGDGTAESSSTFAVNVTDVSESASSLNVGVFEFHSYNPTLTSALNGLGVFASVTRLTNSAPTLAQLLQYDAIIVTTDGSPSNSLTLGNLLADYVDAGGNLITTTFTAQNTYFSNWGRLESGGYLPYASYISNYERQSTEADLPDHYLYDGLFEVDYINAFFRDEVTPSSDATVVGYWVDGTPLALIDSSGVITLTVYPVPGISVSQPGNAVYGDYVELVANAVAYSVDVFG